MRWPYCRLVFVNGIGSRPRCWGRSNSGIIDVQVPVAVCAATNYKYLTSLFGLEIHVRVNRALESSHRHITFVKRLPSLWVSKEFNTALLSQLSRPSQGTSRAHPRAHPRARVSKFKHWPLKLEPGATVQLELDPGLARYQLVKCFLRQSDIPYHARRLSLLYQPHT